MISIPGSWHNSARALGKPSLYCSRRPSCPRSGNEGVPLPADPSNSAPKRVAIVGGGCAGMSAAWQLSRQPGYVIDVYESSWRLGGKAASVRDKDGRILDHGLHVWLGFYENAFRMMRECYDEVGERSLGPLTHRSFDDAFLPEPHVGVARPGPGGRDWTAWSSFFPPEKGEPGTVLDVDSNPYTLASYLLRCFGLLKTLTLSIIGPTKDDVPGRAAARGALRRPTRRPTSTSRSAPSQSGELLIKRMAGLLRAGTLTGAAVMLQAVTIIENWLRSSTSPSRCQVHPEPDGGGGRADAQAAARPHRRRREHPHADRGHRHRHHDRGRSLQGPGAVRRQGLDAINHSTTGNGSATTARPGRRSNSRFLTGIYDFVFAYEDGDRGARARRRRGAARGAADVLHLSRRDVLAHALRHGRRRLRAAVQGPARASPTRSRSRRSEFHFLHALADRRLRRRAAVTSRRCISERRPTGASWPGRATTPSTTAAAGRRTSASSSRTAGKAPGEPDPEGRGDFDAVILATGVGAGRAGLRRRHARGAAAEVGEDVRGGEDRRHEARARSGCARTPRASAGTAGRYC